MGSNKLIRDKNSLAVVNPKVSQEWDYEKNSPLTPYDVAGCSDKKVWWICTEHAHSWRASVGSRNTNGNGCPYCAGQKVLKGFNDLASANKELAKEYNGGYCLVYRLCVNHYHRYAYFESGVKSEDVVIPGIYHTVRPVALEAGPVFVENSRQYTVIDTQQFGKCVQMEVGAMLVGRIVNEVASSTDVIRGTEKGHFEYGGSTIIVLVPANKIDVRPDLKKASESGQEIAVKMGECVGYHIDASLL